MTENFEQIYEEMRRKCSFSSEELSEIKTKRKTFENKINGPEKSKEIFDQYIEYEKGLITTIFRRVNNNCWATISTIDTKNFGAIERFIAKHVKGLYEQELNLFPKEEELWNNYLKFCKTFDYFATISSTLEKMLQHFENDVTLWLRTIEWKLKNTEDMDKVKELVIRGVQKHPNNQDIHLKFFTVMLKEASKIKTALHFEDNTKSERDIELKRIECIYTNSKKNIHNVEYLTEFLTILEQYEFTNNLQNGVINDMMNAFPKEELVWHTLAERAYKGLPIKLKELKEIAFEPEEKNDQNQSVPAVLELPLKKRILLCCMVYETAVENLQTQKMWTFYIDKMIEIHYDLSTEKELKKHKLYVSFYKAYQLELLSEKHFILFNEYLIKNHAGDSLIERIMKKGTKLHRNSVELWKYLIVHYSYSLRNAGKMYETFYEAIGILEPEVAFPLWEHVISVYTSRCSEMDEQLDNLFKRAIKYTTSNYATLRQRYLCWIYMVTNDIEKTRALYYELTILEPPIYELHKAMSMIERAQTVHNLDKWRICYENRIHYFGKENIDAWTSYIFFESSRGDKSKAQILYKQAKQTLDSNLFEIFKRKIHYCLDLIYSFGPCTSDNRSI